MTLSRRAFLQTAAASSARAGSATAVASAPRRLPGDGAAVGDSDIEGDPRFARYGSQITPTTLPTWGLSDRYSRISQMCSRADERPSRPLPLDAEYRPKPFMATLETFTGAATRQG